MAAKTKAPVAELYDVRSANSGAEVIIGVDLDTAKDECKRLNKEARRVNAQGEPTGMHAGEVTTYEVVSRSGLVVS